MDDYITRDEVLAHFGVKGMRWGVRKERESSSKSSASIENEKAVKTFSKEEYQKAVANQPKKSPREAKKALTENHKKFIDKFEPSEAPGSEKKGLSPQQKKMLITAGVGAAVVGGILAYGYYTKSKGSAPSFDAKNLVPGQSISFDEFWKAGIQSQDTSWGSGGYLHPSSFLREGFTIPSGSTFTRISSAAESSFSNTTYCCSNKPDADRYIAAFRQELGTRQPYKVTFKSTGPVRVPDLATTLDALKEAMYKTMRPEFHESITSERIIREYNSFSGGGWDFSNPRIKSFFEILTQRGYGAIVDEMDAGVVGDAPLVLFSKNVSAKAADLLTNSEIKASMDNLLELSTRKL